MLATPGRRRLPARIAEIEFRRNAVAYRSGPIAIAHQLQRRRKFKHRIKFAQELLNLRLALLIEPLAEVVVAQATARVA